MLRDPGLGPGYTLSWQLCTMIVCFLLPKRQVSDALEIAIAHSSSESERMRERKKEKERERERERERRES